MPRYATCRSVSTGTVKIHAAQMIFIGIILSVVGTSSTVSSSQPRFMFSTRARSMNSSSNVDIDIDFDIDIDININIPNNAYLSPKSVSVQLSNVHTNTNTCQSKSKRDIFDTCDEISDCFHLDDGHDTHDTHDECNPYKEQNQERPFAFHANIKENIHVTSESPLLCSSSPPSSLSSQSPSPFTLSFMEKKRLVSLRKMIHKATHGCYQTCPSVMYSSSNNRSTSASASASRGIFGGTSMSMVDDNNVQFASLLRLRKPKTETSTTESESESTSPPSTTAAQEIENEVGIEEEEEIIREPSQRILSGIIKPLIPTSIWNSLTGNEFYYPSTLSKLIQTGIKITTTTSTNGKDGNDNDNTITILDEEEQIDGDYIDWKPADSKTKKLLAASNSKDDKKKSDIPDALLKEDQVLVWIGKFMTKNNGDEGYGSSLPLVKTISVIPLSPKKFAELLMDSSKVPLYNKMSLGRKDIVVFQQGVDTEAETNTIDENGTSSSMIRGGSGGSSFSLDGEAKIVRNVTKPPLSKKLMDFVTLMYARRLNENDNVSPGYLGGSTSTGDSNDGSYIVVTRAVSGGRWSVGGGKKDTTTESSSNNNDDDNKKGEMTRSEILLGVNLLRSIPGEPDKTEVTAVTHVYSPSVPKMLAGSVGVKGAIDFVKDIRTLCG